MLPKLAFCFASLMILPALTAQTVSEFIFQPGHAPFASSHASTVVELPNGSLLSAWFGGESEGASDVAIWSARREHNHWSAPVELAREPGVACWNPVLFHTQDRRLWLYYKFGTSPATWTAARKYSDDEGKSWSRAEHLPAGLIGPARAKPLVLPSGVIVSGSSIESYRSWAVWIERSTDDGKSWAKIGPIEPPLGHDPATDPGHGDDDWKYTYGIIQPSVIALGGKHLRLYARPTTPEAHVYIADSYDDGNTWSPARALEVPNPNSGLDAVSLKDGRVVLINNNTTTGRSPLNLSVSRDGEHFRSFLALEDQPGEFSYPSIIEDANGDLSITYTWNRKSIRYVRVPLAQIPR
jgi:predicted neuraminidase